MAISITGVSVFYFDENVVPQEIGTQVPVDPGSGADAICRQFVTKLIHRSLGETTRLHRFARRADGAIACPVYDRLLSLRRGAQMEADARAVAQHFARWGWMQRYVLLFISFQREGEEQVAIIMAKSASQETFSLSPSRLVTELKRIFRRDVEKGVLFPYFVPGLGAVPDTERALVVQVNATAGYLVEALGVEPSPTLAEAVRPRISAALQEGKRGREILRAVAQSLAAEPPPVREGPGQTPVQIDLGGIQVKGTLADLESGRMQVRRDGDRWQIILTASAGGVLARVAGEALPIEFLLDTEAAD